MSCSMEKKKRGKGIQSTNHAFGATHWILHWPNCDILIHNRVSNLLVPTASTHYCEIMSLVIIPSFLSLTLSTYNGLGITRYQLYYQSGNQAKTSKHKLNRHLVNLPKLSAQITIILSNLAHSNYHRHQHNKENREKISQNCGLVINQHKVMIVISST